MQSPSWAPPSFDVLGVPVSATSIPDATDRILDWKNDQTGRFVCIREVPSLMCAVDDPALAALHYEASMVTPDGMPLVVMGKKAGMEVSRTSGADLFVNVVDKGRAVGLKHYLYGGAEGVADALADELRRRFPGAEIVGTECPPFRALTAEEAEATREAIRRSGADMVWVGISSPKQEFWMHANYKQLPATLVGVGAAFDFLTGRVKRAPLWMQKSGLESVHRLMSEPRRLWRRYLILAPRFVWLAFICGNRRPAHLKAAATD